MSIPVISIDTQTEISNYLRDKLSGGEGGRVLFRRFAGLNNKNSPTHVAKFTDHNKCDYLSGLDGVSMEDRQRYISVEYKYFFGFTESRGLREEPEVLKDKPIFLHSENYGEMKIQFGDFNFESCSPVTPVKNDLIFLFMSNKSLKEAKGKKTSPKADYWCVVSEQFLRAWTLIMFDWHETFDKFFSVKGKSLGREELLKKAIYQGNKLMTNSWLKSKIAKESNNLEFTEAESQKKYWFLRTETASKNWVDVYCALVLIARYGETPCPLNVPNTKGESEPQRKSWNLPEDFVGKFLCETVSIHKPESNSVAHIDTWGDLVIEQEAWWKPFNTISTLENMPEKVVVEEPEKVIAVPPPESKIQTPVTVTVTVESNTPVKVNVKVNSLKFAAQLLFDTPWY
jgi:hypothetical protein